MNDLMVGVVMSEILWMNMQRERDSIGREGEEGERDVESDN